MSDKKIIFRAALTLQMLSVAAGTWSCATSGNQSTAAAEVQGPPIIEKKDYDNLNELYPEMRDQPIDPLLELDAVKKATKDTEKDDFEVVEEQTKKSKATKSKSDSWDADLEKLREDESKKKVQQKADQDAEDKRLTEEFRKEYDVEKKKRRSLEKDVRKDVVRDTGSLELEEAEWEGLGEPPLKNK